MGTQTAGALTSEHVSRAELDRIVALQRAAFRNDPEPSAAVRRSRIDRLCLAMLEHADAIATALGVDYGKRPNSLTKSFEVLSYLGDAADLRDNLENWMKPVALAGGAGFIQQKPLGVVGIIGAWNFPGVLTVQPALAALAAGNRVIIKFPDLHVRTAAVFTEAIAKHLSEEEVAVVVGDLQTAIEFSDLPLDYIFFTGSPTVGKVVGAAAARNLVPVTLELGGKNPIVVARDADLDLAAKRIAQTRLLNAGQICVCPDYVWVPRETQDAFIGKLSDQIADLFPSYVDSPGVVSIVNDSNYDRVTELVDDAVAHGARKIEIVPESERTLLPAGEQRLVPPTILLDVVDDCRIANEEVFGPVLTVYSYEVVTEAIEYVRNRPHPLAAYWYGEDSAEFEAFLTQTNSGGVTRNDAFIHGVVKGAPFGGIGNSGSGAYHGKWGFDAFTHRRPVVAQLGDESMANGLVGTVAGVPEVEAAIDQAISGAIAQLRSQLGLTS